MAGQGSFIPVMGVDHRFCRVPGQSHPPDTRTAFSEMGVLPSKGPPPQGRQSGYFRRGINPALHRETNSLPAALLHCVSAPKRG